MFTKILQKVTHSHQNVPHASMTSADLKPRVSVHYGIPSTASVLAFDPIQHLLAIGTQDGKIKVIGGDNIEALFISSKPVPFKNLEFFQNQGFLVSVSNENELQVWDLQHRCTASKLQWESNITAFSLIYGTHYMYVGDEYGFLSVLKYDSEKGTILPLAYHIPANLIDEVSELSSLNQLSIVGVLPQPGSSGNRVLIAFENGLIVLWDITEDRTVLVRGNKDLQLKDKIVINSPNGAKQEHSGDTSDHEQDDKEISSLCWVSSDGSILAVGYVDGDILLWNLSNDDQKTNNSSNNVTKLQLSSADRRIPVIVLHWCENSANNGHGGQLFVYGGDEIGSEEILTIISLDWSSGLQTLKCVYRVDLTLDGSFADMIIMPNTGASESNKTSSLFVLTNPGQLFFYDDSCLSSLASQSGKKHSVQAIQYPVIIPTIEPYMTVGKLSVIHKEGNFSKALSEAAAKLGFGHAITPATTNWPLTGGIPSEMSLAENKGIERVYIGGYKDGSIRIWDATFPTLSLLYVIGSEVEGIEVAGASASVSAVDFSSSTSSLAVGNECGLVRIHRLIDGSDELSLHFVTATKNEVCNLPNGNKNRCTAVFSLLDSPVRTLQYITSGARLAVGFECGGVAMIDVSSSQLLFLLESVSTSHSPIISLDVKICPYLHNLEETVSKNLNESARDIAFILTKDAHIVLIDSTTGEAIGSQLMHLNKDAVAISMHFIGKASNSKPIGISSDPHGTMMGLLHSLPIGFELDAPKSNKGNSEVSEQHSLISSQGSDDKTEPSKENPSSAHNLSETKIDPPSPKHLGKTVDSYILLCCEDSLHVYSPMSVIQGKKDTISETDLVKPCCWTAVFRRDEKACGLILVYQNGEIEIRSLPDLKVVGETSLMSVLRWSFKTNMDKTMSSSNTGQISLANGCEFAFISLFAFENDFRIPESLPCLHDKVLAAASDAAFSVSSNQKKHTQSTTASGLFGGLIHGLKGGKMDQNVEHNETRETIVAHLETIFSRLPFSDLTTTIDISTSIPDEKDVVELNIDDIQIDDIPLSSVKITRERKDKEIEREKLFEGGSTDMKPKMRTPEEIMAKYRKTGDATSAAAHARDKLVERKEKLEKLSLRTEELQSGAENFSSLAGELAKQMKNRKWWQL